MPLELAPNDEAAWAALQQHWSLRTDTIYLNHGSFGPPPACVRAARQKWLDVIDSQPMDFFVRQFEPAWLAARDRVARFVGAAPGDLIFVENATVGMNIIADSIPLSAGDEVLLTDHEYGAVQRIWQRACQKADAAVRIAELPQPFRSADETVDAIFAAATQRTRLFVVSHVTSPTAVILPVAEICRHARQRGIAVVIDGPHALAQVPLAIDELGCDFYTASCHKWLSGPFGSGFLWAHPRQQRLIRPPVLSWGRIPPTRIESWSDEFVWSGTRNPAAYLAVPAAIDFLEEIGLDAFRARTHWLAQQARRMLVELTQLEPLVPDDPAWYGSMAHVPLPPPTRSTSEAIAPGAWGLRSMPQVAMPQFDDGCPVSNPLQHLIWRRLGIELPIVEFHGRRYIRVSCHLYNDAGQIERLAGGLRTLLAEGN